MGIILSNQAQFQEEMKTLVAAATKQGEDEAGFSENRRRFSERGRGGDDGSGGDHWKYRKLDMPLFEGTDPNGWILRGEKYFAFYRLTESEKLDAAVVAMEGDALRWFTFESKRNPMRTWAELKAKVLLKYRPTNAGSLHEQWLATTQTTTVAEYQKKFIELASPLDDVPSSIMIGQFVNGLREEIKAEVRLLNPYTLNDTMDLASRVEERNRVNALLRGGYGSGRTGSFSYFSKSPFNATTNSATPGNSKAQTNVLTSNNYNPVAKGGPLLKHTPTVNSTGSQGSNSVAPPRSTATSSRFSGEVKRLTDRELQEKRAKGLCFRCDERWGVGHQCKRREVSVLLVDEEEGENDGEDGEFQAIEIPEEEEIPTTVSMNSIVGLSNPRTMKLIGTIGGGEVVVMVDPGATHNFISLKAVEHLGIPVQKSGGFGVSLGNGEAIRGTGICRDVKLRFNDEVMVTEDFLPLELGNSDVILGVQWLEKLGSVVTNWKTQVMNYKVGEETVTLRGDPSLTRSKISLKSMLRVLRKHGGGILVEYNHMARAELTKAEQPLFLCELLEEFGEVFEQPQGLPPRRGHEHAIVLKEGSNPVGVRPYRYPQIQKDEIERLIREMLEAGIIKPSSSPFSSPVLLVKKKDGSWRFCVDYRALNKETIPDKYPIPVIDELLDELHGSRIFSKLDLKAGYHQILVRPEDTHKTAFRTHEGHYEFLVMPFGLTNAPATFQSLMNEVLRSFLRKFVLVFFDDILVYSSCEADHIKHLNVVLGTLKRHKLFANFKKCEFGKKEVAYLGHVISDLGVAVDQEKVQAIREWEAPRNLRELRGFLGLTGYYRKFLANYAQIAQPLTDQLRKDCFGWTIEASYALERLKEAMITAPVLAMPDFQKLFILETDASGYGLGAVLMQDTRPIAYYSRILGPRARGKSIYEKELMAVCLSVQKWKHYLLGRHFVIRTDQQSLRYITQQREIGADYQKWVRKLIGFDFEIQYKPGTANRVADALSRKGNGELELGRMELGALLKAQGIDWSELEKEVQGDEGLQQGRVWKRGGQALGLP